jgi:nucleotide-binding universal stress UspA family protein
MQRILAALDFSDATPALLSTAEQLVKAFGATLRLVHTEPPPTSSLGYGIGTGAVPVDMDVEAHRRNAELDENALRAICRDLREKGIPAECVQLEGPTAEKIREAAEDFDADLILIGSHEHGLMYHLIFGSVRESLLKHATRPVLVVPAPPAEES